MKFRDTAAAAQRLCAEAMLLMLAPPPPEEPRTRRRDRFGSDRGDVPGWVMITMMTAIVVIALLAIFKDAVLSAVTNAFNSITGKP